MVSPGGAAAEAQQLISWDPDVPLCLAPQRKSAGLWCRAESVGLLLGDRPLGLSCSWNF